MIKDLLILLSIHPEKGWVRKRSSMVHVLLAACFYDLVLKGYLKLPGGRIACSRYPPSDTLLHDLSGKLARNNGKKFSWVVQKFFMLPGKYYRTQMLQLEQKQLISSRRLEWLGITWGKRYRVNKIRGLKPLIAEIERALIYGRQPGLSTRLLIELFGTLGLLGIFVPDRELKKTAKRRYKELSKRAFNEDHESHSAIRKELRSALRRNKVHPQ
ncbi:MAG: GPP34 family phosphoprotein [Bacteroidales bacterium]